MTRTGLFGGSFNPIHVAHLVVAECARADAGLDEVLFVPARRPPHKHDAALAPGAQRLAMVQAALAGNDAFCACAAELERSGPSYTLLTVREIRRHLSSDAELVLILGGDMVADLPNWWHAQELVDEVGVIAVDRPGSRIEGALPALRGVFGAPWCRELMDRRVEAPLLEVSSTDIRRRVASGRSVRYLVPEPVRAYIHEHGLYR
jgi:nicotinate-nucleotide adenylyltransferase